jgi:tetratricopeptide (TPR) repeat protein
VNDAERKRLLAKIQEHIELAKTSRDDEDYEDAIEELESAVSLIDGSSWHDEPSNGMIDGENEIASRLADCLGMLGGNQRRLKRFDDALASFARGRKLEEDRRYGINSSYNIVNAITLPIETGAATASEQADALFKAVQALDFQTTRGKRRLDRWAWADYGECALLLGDLQQATTAYGEFKRLSDNDAVASHVRVLARLRDALQLRDPAVALLVQDGIALLDPKAA